MSKSKMNTLHKIFLPILSFQNIIPLRMQVFYGTPKKTVTSGSCQGFRPRTQDPNISPRTRKLFKRNFK